MLIVVVPLLMSSDEAFSGLVGSVSSNLFEIALKVGIALVLSIVLLSYLQTISIDKFCEIQFSQPVLLSLISNIVSNLSTEFIEVRLSFLLLSLKMLKQTKFSQKTQAFIFGNVEIVDTSTLVKKLQKFAQHVLIQRHILNLTLRITKSQNGNKS